MVLLQAAASWAREPGRPLLLVATIDHGLRPEARREAEAVGALAASLGLGHAILTWDERPGRVSQEAARDARYRLLRDHARAIGARRLATAHTADDQAETLLMRMASGSGLAGLAGMAPESARGDILHLRPFLGFAKADLVATCRARGWAFVEDPSNAEPRFARVRWRRLMLPLAAEGLDARRLGRLAERLRRADRALEAAASVAEARLVASRPEGGLSIAFGDLLAEPEEIALRVLLRALQRGRPDVPIRLDRAETALAALAAAHREGRRARRSLAGSVLTLTREGMLVLDAEPSRNRGR
ncbi:tRNA(Ile)-lysidine synthase [Enterovirga rhinocerotis]|uniref:tRNA(Ile)-lysidine synthase n=2 Tax=Enterovirga rhinocerotis TaxID=1339210 RepID=A0A4R7BV75_9HYPH|nr:tRNA(Ile)-lysidine synthase [Enterovirga rhinocerotis]